MKLKKTPSPELQEWLDLRARAYRIKSAISEEGGHMSLKESVVDPTYLEEPLRTEAMEYLRLHEPRNMDAMLFDPKENQTGPLS